MHQVVKRGFQDLNDVMGPFTNESRLHQGLTKFYWFYEKKAGLRVRSLACFEGKESQLKYYNVQENVCGQCHP
jgi:hypothetical protein